MTHAATFRSWLKNQLDRQDSVGDLARDLFADDEAQGFTSYKRIRRYLIDSGNDRDYVMAALERAWEEYKAEPSPMVPERWYYRPQQVAQMSGVSLSEVYRSIYAGELKAQKYKTKVWLISKEDVDNWIARCSAA
jgi:excisionase family DNA binding protein